MGKGTEGTYQWDEILKDRILAICKGQIRITQAVFDDIGRVCSDLANTYKVFGTFASHTRFITDAFIKYTEFADNYLDVYSSVVNIINIICWIYAMTLRNTYDIMIGTWEA